MTVEQIKEDDPDFGIVCLLDHTVNKDGGIHHRMRFALGEHLIAHVDEGIHDALMAVGQQINLSKCDV